MRKEFTTLHLKESAIIAAFDELSVIHAIGHVDMESLQTMLSALLAYPDGRQAKHLHRDHGTTAADHCVQKAENLLRLCLLGQAPALALQTIDEALGIALSHVQAAITRYAGSN